VPGHGTKNEGSYLLAQSEFQKVLKNTGGSIAAGRRASGGRAFDSENTGGEPPPPKELSYEIVPRVQKK